ncbi:MAG TPA: FkbM family methyltransferase [Candidatus Omnitrophota bacterium]|nr:FkbM family methyltransferase [Candidatus Omnitrophota bacterium]HPD85241.1 FkbM family methyltransferase [Candidatus Omnitrophota bacterium]HRZ04258.1 FkbM family methyltransferase [Candidatus Omnitrophota bacterium]
MKTITKIRILNSLGLFNVARSVYYGWGTSNPRILNFYSQLVKQGSLCFDIGANIGRKTDIFLKLGARVIAVEPNPECVGFLKRKYRFNKRVVIINKAMDSQEGEKDLYACEANSLSSLSKEWIDETKAKGRYKDFKWDKKMKVATTTLDQLVAEYGKPDYCKIDVEGYEINVLRGLTQPIPVISFEFAPENMGTMPECIKRLSDMGSAVFNISLGETLVKFVLPQWVPSQEIAEILNPEHPQYQYGEIYARFKILG